LKILFIPEKKEGVDKGEILPGEIFFVKTINKFEVNSSMQFKAW
jgi:hypothetical protein